MYRYVYMYTPCTSRRRCYADNTTGYGVAPLTNTCNAEL